MRPASMFGVLMTVWSCLLPAPSSAAVTFPLDYAGSYRLTVTVRNEFGSGLCANEAALSITLTADGQLSWQIAELEARIESPSNAPATCTIRPTGRTNVIAGTHDRVSRYSVPSGNPSFPPITGSFDEQHLRGEYTAGPSFIEFDLPAVGHRIAIEPDPTKGFDFQMGILEGRGFKIVMRDPHGRDHLDLATLKIIVGGSSTVPGTDTTQYALSRLGQGFIRSAEESSDSRTRVFRIVPDRTKLMQGQDIFAIPFNGDWRIELRLCDQAGSCFGAVYEKVYFGPFVMIPSVANVVDGRCASQPDPFLKVTSVIIGNIGIDSPKTAIYAGLVDAASGSPWTFYLDDFGDGTGRSVWWQGLVQPMLPKISVPSGALIVSEQVLVPDSIAVPAGSGTPSQRRLPFPAGLFRFVTAALDMDTGALRADQHDVLMCDK